jgi:hypothetical protein
MEELERFAVLNSYAKTIDILAKWDMQLAYELSYRIIQYGIYGKEPPTDSSPFMLASFEQIKKPIDTCRNKSWNAKKNWEKVLNQNEIKSKSNDNQIKRKEKEKIKIKKENIKEKEPKKKYLDFVYLTDKQYNELLRIFWQERLDNAIETLNNYIGSKWKHYDSHYHTIRKRNQDFIQEKLKREKLNTTQHLDTEEDLLWTIVLKR